MADENFHEIQLSGKQLVFLFMATVVLAVIVFLLGVSVGRGVRATAPQTADAGAGQTAAPPPTQPAPGDLDYHEKLVGRGTPDASAKPPANPPSSNPPATNPAPTPPSASAPPPTPPPAAANPKPAPTQSAPAPPPPAATVATANEGWKVQVGAFNSKANAEALVSKLKAKGYAAFLFNAPPPSLPYHVRVGPFAQRADAAKVVSELQKLGEKGPKVIR